MPNVDFDIRDTHPEGGLERRQAVFQFLPGVAPVTHALGSDCRNRRYAQESKHK
jgi:hypothetical protein